MNQRQHSSDEGKCDLRGVRVACHLIHRGEEGESKKTCEPLAHQQST
jgi:hypothetical protein